MGLIGSIVGGVGALAGGALAGSKINKAYKDAINGYNKRIAEVKAHRDKVYYQDPTQTAENRAAVTEMQELLDDQAQNARGVAAVTGGTGESEAIQKQAAANAVGKVMRQQAAEGAAKKEQAYQAADQQIDAYQQYIANAKMANAQAKANAISGAAGGLAGAAGLLPF